jgi:type IV pilus assembly protein PilC
MSDFGYPTQGFNEKEKLAIKAKNKYSLKVSIRSKKIAIKHITLFCRQFSTMLGAGLIIINSLDTLKRQTENKKLKIAIENIIEDIQKGKPLSEAMRDTHSFPIMLISMVEVGEVSGQLDVILERLSNYYEKENKLIKKIRSSLMYPMFIAVISFISIAFLITKVLPVYKDMFSQFDAELPWITVMLLSLSDGIKNNLLIIGGVILASIFILKRLSKSAKFNFFIDNLKLNIIILGKVNKKVLAARFARTLSIMLSSGIPLIKSMDLIENTIKNTVALEAIREWKQRIKNGDSLNIAISESNIFPPMLIHMIGIGEETGNLDNMLSKASDYLDDEIDIELSTLVTLIEPITIVILTVIVGIVVVSIILPMFSIYKYML